MMRNESKTKFSSIELSRKESVENLMLIDSPMELHDFTVENLGVTDLSKTFTVGELFPDVVFERSKKYDCERFLPSMSKKKKGLSKKKSVELQCKEKKYQEKCYEDFSQVSDKEAMRKFGINLKGRPTLETFPTKLHKIIERNEIDGYSNVISWLPHGRAFKIHDQNAFVHKVMSHYFYISKFTSFIRQLSIYGFRKVGRKNTDKGAYYHEMFLCGRQGLCAGIMRLKTKTALLKSKFDPNFYDMPPVVRMITVEDIKRGYIDDAPNKPRIIKYHKEHSDDTATSSERRGSDTIIESEDTNGECNGESQTTKFFKENILEETRGDYVPDPYETYMSQIMSSDDNFVNYNNFSTELEEELHQLNLKEYDITNMKQISSTFGKDCDDFHVFNTFNLVPCLEAKGNFCYSTAA